MFGVGKWSIVSAFFALVSASCIAADASQYEKVTRSKSSIEEAYEGEQLSQKQLLTLLPGYSFFEDLPKEYQYSSSWNFGENGELMWTSIGGVSASGCGEGKYRILSDGLVEMNTQTPEKKLAATISFFSLGRGVYELRYVSGSLSPYHASMVPTRKRLRLAGASNVRPCPY